MKRNWIRLPLEGAYNVRELGGLPAMDEGVTAWHRFLRADQMSDLTGGDIRKLLAYGVNTVIDLRSPSETSHCPDSPGLLKCVDYHNIPFMESDVSPEGQMNIQDMLKDLGGLYITLLKRKSMVKELFSQIERAQDGCILFHCTAGKDRTGVLALLLLMLAGVDRQDCQTNYMQSFTNLTRDERYLSLSRSEYGYLIRSAPEDIECAYGYIAGFPQGIRGYLEDCEVETSCMEHVRLRCLD